MIKQTSAPYVNTSRGRRAGDSRAFTLVELLVVIGIIVLLIGLLTPMAMRSYRSAERTRVAGDLQAIANALEAYKQDHSAYPQPDPLNTDAAKRTLGSQILYRALIGADITGVNDGSPGPGFRIRTGGKVWGPYLQSDRFRIANGKILDRYRMPILYYAANGKPNINLPGGYIDDRSVTAAARPLYDVSQNKSDDRAVGLNLVRFRLMLGDDTVINGGIDGAPAADPPETAAHTGPFILWSAGPDQLYGPDANNVQEVERSDDITNFRS